MGSTPIYMWLPILRQLTIPGAVQPELLEAAWWICRAFETTGGTYVQEKHVVLEEATTDRWEALQYISGYQFPGNRTALWRFSRSCWRPHGGFVEHLKQQVGHTPSKSILFQKRRQLTDGEYSNIYVATHSQANDYTCGGLAGVVGGRMVDLSSI